MFLAKNQTPLGGFGKQIDCPPDILHSFYGVAGWSLATPQNEVVHRIDPLLGITVRAVEAFRLNRLQ